MPLVPPWPASRELRAAATHIHGFDAAAHRHLLVPGEETLTDSVMLGLMRRRFPYVHFRGRLPKNSHLKVHQFDNTTEGRTGADWNLLFKLSTGRLNFRIQAKRLYRTGAYSSMKKDQMDRLIAVSRRQGAIPLYAFYNGPSSMAPIRANCRISGEERRGCTVVPAAVVQAGTLPKSRNGVGSAAIPLECLASCFCFDPTLGGGSPPTPGSDDGSGPDEDQATSKTDAKPSSLQRTLGIVTAAARLAANIDMDLEAFTQWPTALEVAVQAWLADDPASLDELSTSYFADTSHVVLVTD
ncbi:MAG: DUF6615 family protein [Jatrophihabitans sp.]|uniref:DUF6615 family protein n=1 Tax=Jatrophihabitans sp. TaxID=1932789 RepID=UPI003F7E6D8E